MIKYIIFILYIFNITYIYAINDWFEWDDNYNLNIHKNQIIKYFTEYPLCPNVRPEIDAYFPECRYMSRRCTAAGNGYYTPDSHPNEECNTILKDIQCTQLYSPIILPLCTDTVSYINNLCGTSLTEWNNLPQSNTTNCIGNSIFIPSGLIYSTDQSKDFISAKSPFYSNTLIILISINIAVLIIHLIIACCLRYPNKNAIAPNENNIYILPEGREFDIHTSKVYMGTTDNYMLDDNELHTDPMLQRGVILTRPARHVSSCLCWNSLKAELLCIIVLLSPIILKYIPLYDLDNRIAFFHFQLVYVCVIHGIVNLLGWIGLRMFATNCSKSLFLVYIYILLSLLSIPVLAFYCWQSFDSSFGYHYGLTRNDFTYKPEYSEGSIYTFFIAAFFSLEMIFGAYQTVYITGTYCSNKEILDQPGLPVEFDISQQKVLAEYLRASNNNLNPSAASHISYN